MTEFGRTPGTPIPQFIPGDKHKTLPLGNADDQVAEAMARAKAENQRPETSLAERIAKMDAMYVNTAIDFLDGLSQHERERYLIAERAGKNRRTILGRYGW